MRSSCQAGSRRLQPLDADADAARIIADHKPALSAEWPLRKLCADKALAGNDVPDAWLAAAVIHKGEHMVSFDTDFKRLLSRAQFTRLTV